MFVHHHCWYRCQEHTRERSRPQEQDDFLEVGESLPGAALRLGAVDQEVNLTTLGGVASVGVSRRGTLHVSDYRKKFSAPNVGKPSSASLLGPSLPDMVHIHICIYVYIYTSMCTYMYTYMRIYTASKT